jgi:16S rRNA (guanine527-N7)-methyltransferase
MTEEDARTWCRERFDAAANNRLELYVDLLVEEATRQNLIAASTIQAIWSRHIVDSAQLLAFAPDSSGVWVDIGSGAGLPGVVIAAATNWNTILVEPRKLRTDFLAKVVDALDLSDRVEIVQSRIDQVKHGPASVISARAVSRSTAIFAGTRDCADLSTTFILPKGASVEADLAEARETWQGMFHVEQSITDPGAGIIVATGVAPR